MDCPEGSGHLILPLCSVSFFESVFVMAWSGCGHGRSPRVAAGVACGSTVRGPACARRFLLPGGCACD